MHPRARKSTRNNKISLVSSPTSLVLILLDVLPMSRKYIFFGHYSVALRYFRSKMAILLWCVQLCRIGLIRRDIDTQWNSYNTFMFLIYHCCVVVEQYGILLSNIFVYCCILMQYPKITCFWQLFQQKQHFWPSKLDFFVVFMVNPKITHMK